MVKRVARKREVERGGKRSKGNGKRKIPRSRGWFEEKGRGGVAVKGGNRIRSEERKPLANPLNSGLLDTLIFRNPTRDLLRDGEGATDFHQSSLLPLLDRVNIAKFSFQENFKDFAPLPNPVTLPSFVKLFLSKSSLTNILVDNIERNTWN